MDKQVQFYSNEAYNRNFPYYYRFTDYYNSGNSYKTLQYGYWDGNNWNKIGPNTYIGSPLRLSMWNNQIIGYGRVVDMDGMKAKNHQYFGVMKYKNGRWDSIPGCSFDSSTSIQACGLGKSIYILVFDLKDNSNNKIYRYDSSLSRPAFVCKFEGYYYNIDLYAGSKRLLIPNITSIGGIATNGFAYIENDTVKRCNSSNFRTVFSFAIDKVTDVIYGMNLKSDPMVYSFANAELPARKTYLKMTSAYSPLQVYNGQLIWQSYDVPNNKFYHILCQGDSIWKQIYALKTNGITLTNPYASVNGIYTNLYSNGNSYSMVLGNGAEINGHAFIDKDSNCIIDSNDYKLKHFPVVAESSSFYSGTETDDSGYYQLYVPLDTVSLETFGHGSSCYNKQLIASQNNSVIQKNIAILPPSNSDVSIQLLQGPNVRWNANNNYSALIINNGKPIDSIHFEFKIDPKLSVSIVDNNFYSANKNVAKGHLFDLDYYEKRWVTIQTWIDSGLTKPDTVICNSAFAYGSIDDSDSSNNRDSACQLVVYSHDPNYKTCVQKTIPPIKSSRLEYYIEFQNEGNDDAYDVLVVDPLSGKLDPNSIEIIACSHPYTVEMTEGQLKIYFKNIHLKPKKNNEALSKGFIHFYINTVKNLKVGDSIQNNAYIYFDLNAPVITNVAVVKIEYSSDIEASSILSKNELLIYPNPAKDELNLESSSLGSISIVNLLGETVFEAEMQESPFKIDCSQLSNGLYILRCGNRWSKFIIQK